VTVISIQSQVVHGHVGNSAAVFPSASLRHRGRGGPNGAVEQSSAISLHARRRARRRTRAGSAYRRGRTRSCRRLQGLDLRLFGLGGDRRCRTRFHPPGKSANRSFSIFAIPSWATPVPASTSTQTSAPYFAKALFPWRTSLRQTSLNWSISLDRRRQVLKDWSRPPVGWGYRQLS